MMQSADRASIVAIVNPASGPGTAINTDYAKIVQQADAAGVRLIGYVSTQYGKRASGDVKRDMDRWVAFYPEINGFFFDEQASNESHLKYYHDLFEYAAQKISQATIFANPGTECARGFFSINEASTHCLWEPRGSRRLPTRGDGGRSPSEVNPLTAAG